jgi:DNA polymerase
MAAHVTAEQATDARRERLAAVFAEACECRRCPQLAETRTQVVFGAGNAHAQLMFVGEAPGRTEDEQGAPFVGRAGALLDELLEGIGLARSDVFIANVLMCRPPGNRDPLQPEIDNCQEWLWRKLELIRPIVVCSLGNFATKLLRGDQTGITRIHGRVEERRIGTINVRLLPLFHPAAALYTPSNVELMRDDMAQIPELLALPPLADPEPVQVTSPAASSGGPGLIEEVDQLGLF